MLSAIKNFGIAFVIAAVVFAIIAFFATSYLVGVVDDMFAPETGNGLDNILVNTATKEPTSEPTAEPTSTKTEEEVKGESFNMLLVVKNDTDDAIPYPADTAELDVLVESGDIDEDKLGVLSTDFRSEKPVAIVLIRVNKSAKLYSFTPLSTIMKVWSPNGDITLAEYTEKYGIDGLVRKIPALTGITVDKYAVVFLSSLTETADELGKIEYNVPVDVYCSDGVYGSSDLLKQYESGTAEKDEKSVKPEKVISSGLQTITGKELAELMQFGETSSTTVASKLSIVAGCSKAYISNISEMETEDVQKTLQKLVDNDQLETNITKEWIDANSGIIAAYSDYDRITQSYPASFKTQVTEFGTRIFVIPNIDVAVETFLAR